MRRLLLALLLIAMPCSASAQQMLLHADGPLPSFEVVSIKPGTYWSGTGPFGSSPTMWLLPMTTRQFIAMAYGQPMLVGNTSLRVFGGPSWIDHDHYSVQMKIPDDIFLAMKTMTPEQKLKQVDFMQQSLLAQRYHLKVHFEMREMQIYELHVTKGGLKLKPDEANDQPSAIYEAQNSRGAKMGVNHATMGELSDNFSIVLDRPVIDKTTVGERYTFNMLFAPTGTAFERRSTYSAETSDAPSLFKAMNDLGLELVPVKGPIEVVVVDSIDHPSEN